MTSGFSDMTGSAMVHGGDLARAVEQYGRARDQWLDLSTGINSISYPVGDIPEETWKKLPQDTDLDNVLAVARQAYCVPDSLSIAALPGTQAAIQCLPHCVGPVDQVVIRTPTYDEHESVWRRFSAKMTTTNAWSALSEGDVGVIVNPNNPDGTLIPPADLVSTWHEQASEKLLIVDEAFADCDPAMSVLPHIRNERILVLRSFGKFFGLAGLRLGFLIGPPALVDAVNQAAGPWAVSGPALVIGARALWDRDWIADTRAGLSSDASQFDQLLKDHGLSPEGDVPLYRLIREKKARHLHHHFAQHGIWTRIFSQQPDWLRLGVPRTEADRDRVMQALRAI